MCGTVFHPPHSRPPLPSVVRVGIPSFQRSLLMNCHEKNSLKILVRSLPTKFMLSDSSYCFVKRFCGIVLTLTLSQGGRAGLCRWRTLAFRITLQTKKSISPCVSAFLRENKNNSCVPPRYPFPGSAGRLPEYTGSSVPEMA